MFPWCIVLGAWFQISSRYLFIYLTLKNEEVQNLIPISYSFPKAVDINSPNLLVLFVVDNAQTGETLYSAEFLCINFILLLH